MAVLTVDSKCLTTIDPRHASLAYRRNHHGYIDRHDCRKLLTRIALALPIKGIPLFCPTTFFLHRLIPHPLPAKKSRICGISHPTSGKLVFRTTNSTIGLAQDNRRSNETPRAPRSHSLSINSRPIMKHNATSLKNTPWRGYLYTTFSGRVQFKIHPWRSLRFRRQLLHQRP
jgi:hypothetical protein